MKKRSDGRYQVKRKINGKYVYFYGKTKEEALKKADYYQETSNMPPTFAEMAQKWKDEEWESMSFTTQKGYTSAYNRAVERFGDMQLDEITTPDINGWLQVFMAQKYALKTVQKHKSIVSIVYNYAIVNGYTDINPATPIKIKRGLPKNPRVPPSDEDIKKISEAKDEWIYPKLLLYTGLRKGEALALTYEDFDFEKKTIRVDKEILFDSNNPILVNRTKTEAGNRTVLLPDILADEIPRNKKGPLFAYTFRTFRTAWKKYCERVGVNCTPHQLRHAYASMLYDAGINVKDAQKMMGHADITTTQNIYTHIFASRAAKSNDKLNDYFNGNRR